MKRFFKNEKGLALIEFALVLPIIFALTFPMIDYARYILLQQKVIKTAYVLGDSITMSRPIDVLTRQSDGAGNNGVDQNADFLTVNLLNNSSGDDLMDTIPLLMSPFQEDPAGDDMESNRFQVIISHVLKPDDVTPPQLMWQFNEDDNAFDGTSDSAIGNISGFGNPVTANLPDELTDGMQANENIIVVEVFANHLPITPDLSGGVLGLTFLAQQQLQYTSYMRARFGDLQYIWSVNCPPGNPAPEC